MCINETQATGHGLHLPYTKAPHAPLHFCPLCPYRLYPVTGRCADRKLFTLNREALNEIETFADKYGWHIGIAAVLLGGAIILYLVAHTTTVEYIHSGTGQAALLPGGFPL